jgi:hypothetical protein
MHGKGTLIYPNGERYEGNWVYGKRHGFGTYFYLDSGAFGFFRTKWRGERVGCDARARAAASWAQRCVYAATQGARRRALRLLRHPRTRLQERPPSPHPFLPTSLIVCAGRYEGEWVDDRIQGRGKSIYANGNVYEGEWVDGRINGFGTLTYQDGDKYIGEWVDGKMNGQGTYVYADGDKYEGQWKDDKRHGKGTVTYRGQDGTVVEKYEGDWFEGKMHGMGRYGYADGGVYEGQWVDGKMCGKGTYIFPNGNKYEGEWVDDVKEGYGYLIYVNVSVGRREGG